MIAVFRTALSAAAAAALFLGIASAARAEIGVVQLQWNARTGAYPAAGGFGGIAVNATPDVYWQFGNLPSWIVAVSGSPWTGSGVATFYVHPNPDAKRSATISAAGKSFTITQAAGTCGTQISPSSLLVGSGGSAERSLNVGSGCFWQAESTASWLSLRSGGGIGTGYAFYTVAPADVRRSAAIFVGSSLFVVDQNGPSCGVMFPSPGYYDFPPNGGQGSFDLFVNSTCPAWTVTSDSSWVVVHNGSGKGPGAVTYSVEPNPHGYVREAVLVVNGNPHFVRQQASESPGFVMLQPGAEGFDTSWGSGYYQNGTPNDQLLTYGGHGDRFHDYFYFDVGFGLAASQVAKAELWLYVTQKAVADPQLQLWHLNQPWSEAGVTATSNPGGAVIRNLPALTTGWNRFDITDLYKRWKNGTYANYGVKLAPAGTPVNARGYIASSDNSDAEKRPRIVLAFQEEPLYTSLARQKTLLIVGGSGYQEIFYNYSNGATATSPYAWASGGVPYELPLGSSVGMYHYDFGAGRFTQAVYSSR